MDELPVWNELDATTALSALLVCATAVTTGGLTGEPILQIGKKFTNPGKKLALRRFSNSSGRRRSRRNGGSIWHSRLIVRLLRLSHLSTPHTARGTTTPATMTLCVFRHLFY